MNNDQKIQIRVPDEVAKALYSNVIEIRHSKEEFCLDFLSVFPPTGVMVSRVVVSPGHLKRMIKALEINLQKYESQFGSIEEAGNLDGPKIGF
ncbi:MAG: DUF3467 domain-containing protein [Candidatus Nealsonbacteria bacterium]|nr:DUF3467 domain-containing protein [Candidatus Nealsonbacteria bacterium]